MAYNAQMKIERSLQTISMEDLKDLSIGSKKVITNYFIEGNGVKWKELYDFENPLVVALCQGAAMHFYDKRNGIKDFDVWFFYPFNEKHLPYRKIWNWDYLNPKFGKHPLMHGYQGRKVDVIVRSIKNYVANDPVKTIQQFLMCENTKSSRELAKKAVVLLEPEKLIGVVPWYKREIKNG